MDDRQKQRAALNETRFRNYNEQTSQAVVEFDGHADRGPFDVMCECALPECEESISITSEEYAHARSSALWFLVRPDHLLPEVEFLVEQHDRYWIIQKVGIGAEIAKQRS